MGYMISIARRCTLLGGLYDKLYDKHSQRLYFTWRSIWQGRTEIKSLLIPPVKMFYLPLKFCRSIKIPPLMIICLQFTVTCKLRDTSVKRYSLYKTVLLYSYVGCRQGMYLKVQMCLWQSILIPGIVMISPIVYICLRYLLILIVKLVMQMVVYVRKYNKYINFALCHVFVFSFCIQCTVLSYHNIES